MKEQEEYSLEEVIDIVVGKEGTPARAQYDADIQAFLMGEAIKEARKNQNLTQEELGERIGVKKSQISKIERGHNLTLATISRVFRALELEVSLHIKGQGAVTLA